ncbi:MAG: F0F1 ATP synthase subunit A [Candidatus Andersenbacteria bacterium]
MSDIHISLAAEEVLRIGNLSISNSLLAGIVGSLIIFWLFYLAGRRVAVRPRGGVANLVEATSEAVLDLIDQVTHNRAKTLRFFPLLMTLFVFILVNNWLGLLPGVGSITVLGVNGEVPLLRGATADLNTTLGLAIISVVMTQIYAIAELGLFRHLRKYFSWNPILLFVGLLELVAEFSKMISFSFRLFGNIFAGEVLLVVIAYLMPLVAPLPFFGLELFVGLVQALVFTMLTLVFLEIATVDHSDDGHHEVSSARASHLMYDSVPSR